jgi:NAD(P)-dependent dehydrogenase (short-subunit alcohol dehydrogenase family)
MKVADKRLVMVTGGARGIGADIVERVARRGYPVCFSYLSRDQEANALVERLTAEGCAVAGIRSDVSKADEIEHFFTEAESRFGPLGGFVSNAGFVGRAGRQVANLDHDTLRRCFDVNVIGPIMCAQLVLKRLSTANGGPGGRLVNVSSIAARTGSPWDWVDYAASKGALNTFTVGFGKEVAKQGLQVIGVGPGGVATELHTQAGQPERLARFSDITPIGRPAESWEIADVVVWALLDAPDYLTATTIEVSGGL